MAPGDAGAGFELIIIAVPPLHLIRPPTFLLSLLAVFFLRSVWENEGGRRELGFCGEGELPQTAAARSFCFRGTILRRCFGNESEDFCSPTFSSFLLGKRNFLFPPPFSVFIFPHLSFSQPTFISRNSGSKRRERERERERKLGK